MATEDRERIKESEVKDHDIAASENLENATVDTPERFSSPRFPTIREFALEPTATSLEKRPERPSPEPVKNVEDGDATYESESYRPSVQVSASLERLLSVTIVVRKSRVNSKRCQGRHTFKASLAIVKSAKEDRESYSGDMKDIKQRAQECPNFVGDAFYYDIHKDANRPHLGGDYTIVYTRPVGKVFDSGASRCATFPPSDQRMIRITTVVPKDVGRISDKLAASDMLSPGGGGVGKNFGIVSMHFNHTLFQCMGVIESLDTDPRVNNNPYAATFHIPHQGWQDKPDLDVYPEYTNQREFFEILRKNTKKRGHTISFGMKDMENLEFGQYRGFHFVEIELACENMSGEPDRQLILAIRIPKERKDEEDPKETSFRKYGHRFLLKHEAIKNNVSSSFLLMQDIDSQHDLGILTQRFESYADYVYYAATHPYGEVQNEWYQWSPMSEEDVGLIKIPYEFNPSILERHLLRQEDRILELEKLVKWLERQVTYSLDNYQVNDRALEASAYAHCWLANLKFLQWQHEEAGGLWAVSAEDDDSDMELKEAVDKMNRNMLAAPTTGQDHGSSNLSFMDADEDAEVAMMIDEIAEYEKRGERRGG